jgi:tetratricopeptide (TPR) repeat protein
MAQTLYRAFISYAHADEQWAKWLHRSLESYRLPRRLIGNANEQGKPLPQRLGTIFRDRDEFATAPDLSARVRQALEASESLVVICSPAASRSRWVGEEIRYFQSIGREERIFCLIVAGDPGEQAADDACFPSAIFAASTVGEREPLAADARPFADGKRLAKLKLVAALLGIGLDELRRRDHHRKRRRQALALAGLAGILLLAAAAIQYRLQAQQSAEKSLFYLDMLARETLELREVRDLEARRIRNEELLEIADAVSPGHLNSQARLKLGVLLLEQGNVLQAQGGLNEAMDWYLRSRRILEGLVEADPENHEAMVQLGAAMFYIGRVHRDQGNVDKAEPEWLDYHRISMHLHNLDPRNPEWAMEVAYSYSNLGNLAMRRFPPQPTQTLDYMRQAIEYNTTALMLSPQDEGIRGELVVSYANLADAYSGVCDIGGARGARASALAIAREYLEDHPGNLRFQSILAYALAGLASVQTSAGMWVEAEVNYGESVALLEELSERDPTNMVYQWNLAHKNGEYGQAQLHAGLNQEGWGRMQRTAERYKSILALDKEIRVGDLIQYAAFLVQFAAAADKRGEKELARDLTNSALAVLPEPGDVQLGSRSIVPWQLANFQYWVAHGEPLPRSLYSPPQEPYDLDQARSCKDLDVAFRNSIMAQDYDAAQKIASVLESAGYRNRDFVELCEQYGACGH